jgi:hypothetical protein
MNSRAVACGGRAGCGEAQAADSGDKEVRKKQVRKKQAADERRSSRIKN